MATKPVPGLRVEKNGATGWLVLDRPDKHNALTAAMWQAIPQAIDALDSDAAVRVIVIRGAGSAAFAAGADISEFTGNRSGAAAARDYEATNVAALKAISGAAKPVLAMIHGHCVGGGLAVALSCDMRIAGQSAVFALPPARLGLAYPLDGLRQLLAAVSPSVAKDMIFTARRLDSAEALQVGLVNRVVPDDRLEQEIGDLCTTIAANAPLTLKASKLMLDEIIRHPEGLDRARLQQAADACFDSADYREGQAAFLERRKPVFTGS